MTYGCETWLVSTTEHHHLIIGYKPTIELLVVHADARLCRMNSHMPGQSTLAVAGMLLNVPTTGVAGNGLNSASTGVTVVAARNHNN